MEETRSSTPQDSRNPQATPAQDTPAAPRQRQKSTASTGRKPASGKNRAQKSQTEIRLQAITALINLPEDGRFFLVFETQEGQKETIDTWT